MATTDYALFQDTGDQQRQVRTAAHGGLAYPGEVIVARRWRAEYAHPLTGDFYFRIVLLRQRRTLSSLALPDSRIAVCVPDQSVARQQESIGQELHALREAGLTYLTRQDPQIAGLRRSLEERARELEEKLLGQEARAYAAGEIHTRPGLTASAPQVFTGTHPEEWVTTLARTLLASAYPRLPVGGSRFPRPLEAADVPLLFDGLFAPEESPSGAALLKDFGPGLGLAPGPGPRMVEARDSKLVGLVVAELERGGEHVSGQTLLTQLAHGHGLTYSLAALVLLTYMYSHQPGVELLLRPDHDVLLRDGSRLSGEWLTGERVPDIRWPANLWEQVVELRRSATLSWNAVLPYATLLDPGLSPADDPHQVAEQGQRLQDALRRLTERVAAVRESVGQLASALEESLEPSAQECLERLRRVAEAQGHQDLHARATGLYGSTRRLQADVDVLQRLERLGQDAPETRAAVAYLRAISLPDRYADLEMDRQIILRQIDLATLSQNPGRWEGLRSLFEWFRSRYATAYTQHHASFQREAASLAQEMERGELKARALERLNAIPELGEPLGTSAVDQVRRLRQALPLCGTPTEELPLARHPVCPQCGVPLGQDPPQREAQQALSEVDKALAAQNRRLASRVVRQVLGRRQEPHLERFIKAVQVSDLTGLANILDDGLVSLIGEMLRQP